MEFFGEHQEGEILRSSVLPFIAKTLTLKWL